MKIVIVSILCLAMATKALDVMEKAFLTFNEAKKIWAQQPFDSSRFKGAKPQDRGGMALDLIDRGTFDNRKLAEVKQALGMPDGNFETRSALAYELGKDDRNTYQLVFLPDFSGKTVENVKILHAEIQAKPALSPRPHANPSTSKNRIPIEIEGNAAKTIFTYLSANEINGVKTAKNIVCAKTNNKYHCSLEIDQNGEAYPHP